MATRSLPSWPVGQTTFEVAGAPRPLQRPRFAGGRVYNPSAGDLARFRAAAAPFAPPAHAVASPGPVTVVLEFRFARPASHVCRSGRLAAGAPARHISAPDVDNLAKLVLDALNGLFFADDRQVERVDARKTYADPGAPALTRVTLVYGTDATWVDVRAGP